MNRFVRIGAAATAAFGVAAPAAMVATAQPAAAQGFYPANCNRTPIGWAWNLNCWVGSEAQYVNSGGLVYGLRTALPGYLQGEDADPYTYGAALKYAVKSFQQSQGMTTDGIVGTQTWTAMGRTLLKDCQFQANGYEIWSLKDDEMGCWTQYPRFRVKLSTGKWEVLGTDSRTYVSMGS